MEVSSIKPRFLGNRTMQNLLSDEPTKRSIFSDSTKARTVEWKYITDVNARPFLKTIAGEIDSCISNFEIRSSTKKL